MFLARLRLRRISYHLLPPVQPQLWREAGDPDRAAACYVSALTLAECTPEPKFLAAGLESLAP